MATINLADIVSEFGRFLGTNESQLRTLFLQGLEATKNMTNRNFILCFFLFLRFL